MKVTFKAHGKILLVGGYSILNPNNEGLVLSVSPKVTVTLEDSLSPQCHLTPFDLTYEQQSPPPLPEVNFLTLALSVLNQERISHRIPEKTFSLISSNDPEFGKPNEKTGLGSSGAFVTALTKAYCKFHNLALNKNELFDLSYHAHSTASGKTGSGFDLAASIYGSHLFRKNQSPNNRPIISPLGCNIPPLSFYTVIGKKTSTENMIKALSHTNSEDILNNLSKLNSEIIHNLTTHHYTQVSSLVSPLLDTLEHLGNIIRKPIVPLYLKKVLLDSLQNGAFFATLPGAGGEDSIVFLSRDYNKKESLNTWLSQFEFLKKIDLTIR